jgi:hypothetical protein
MQKNIFNSKTKLKINYFSEYSITGSTYEPTGQILHNGIQINCASDDHKALTEIATICSMCNDSSVDYNEVGTKILEMIKK